MRKALLALLAVSQLVACASQPEAASKAAVTAPASPPAKQLRQAEAAAYERGFLAGRRYQARLDGTRPATPCVAAPGATVTTPAPAALMPAPSTPSPSPTTPANSYAPSGPAQPVTLP